jgi:hypothetical protein
MVIVGGALMVAINAISVGSAANWKSGTEFDKLGYLCEECDFSLHLSHKCFEAINTC